MNRDEALAEMRDWGRRNEALKTERDPIVLRAWLAGANPSEVAAAMGISRPTVYKAIGDNQGAFTDPDRVEVERADGDDGTTYTVTAWRGRAEASAWGMSHRDAVAFLVEKLGVGEETAEVAVDNAQQSMRPYRVL